MRQVESAVVGAARVASSEPFRTWGSDDELEDFEAKTAKRDYPSIPRWSTLMRVRPSQPPYALDEVRSLPGLGPDATFTEARPQLTERLGVRQ